MVALGLAGELALAQAPPVDAAWNGGTFNWTDAARWTPVGVPNNAGTATFNAQISAAASNVRLTQDIAIEALRWSQGTISRQGTGPFSVTANAGVQLSGAANKTLNGVSLILEGNPSWDGAGNLVLTGARVENRGAFDLQSDADLTGTGVFVNTTPGTLRKSAGTDTKILGTLPGLPVTNDGAIEVHSGTIELAGSATHMGRFQAASGATLRFGRGTHRLEGAAQLDIPSGATLAVRNTAAVLWLATLAPQVVPGTLDLGPSARLTADTPLQVGTLNLDSGTLDGVADVRVTSRFRWGSGTLAGCGSLTLARGGWSGVRR